MRTRQRGPSEPGERAQVEPVAPAPGASASTAALGGAQRRESRDEGPPTEFLAGGGGGSALPPPVQAKMEDAFDFSFAQVRVHEDAAAAAVGAAAFTRGPDVHFAPGQYDPHGAAGQELLGHELAHVVQQREGRVQASTQWKGVAGNDDAGLEREADAWGARAARGERIERAGGDGAAPDGVVQRTTRDISQTTDTGNSYTQEMALDKTNRHVQIQLGVKWTKKGTWSSDAAFATWIRGVKSAAYGYLDRKFKLEITPASGAAFFVTIDFLLWDDDSGYEIECHGNTHGRGAMAQAGGKLYELGQATEAGMPDVYAAHEFGHALLGVSDEYANAAVPGRVVTNDNSIMGDFYSQGVAKAEYKVRHFQNIGREVGKEYPGSKVKVVPA